MTYPGPTGLSVPRCWYSQLSHMQRTLTKMADFHKQLTLPLHNQETLKPFIIFDYLFCFNFVTILFGKFIDHVHQYKFKYWSGVWLKWVAVVEICIQGGMILGFPFVLHHLLSGSPETARQGPSRHDSALGQVASPF